MEIKQFLLDQNGKAVELEWEDGSKSGIPYYVEYGLSDFNGDTRAYSEYLQGRTQTYEEERATVGDVNEPVLSMFPNAEIYESRHRMWEQKKVLEDFREEHKPPAPPQPRIESLPEDARVLLQGNAEDKSRWSEKMKTVGVVQELSDKAQKLHLMGEHERARELEAMAAAQQVGVNEFQKKKYSFVEKEEKQTKAFGKSELERIKAMPSREQEQYIIGNMERVTALCQGWRDMADDPTDEGQQVTYLLDDGTGGISKHRGGH